MLLHARLALASLLMPDVMFMYGMSLLRQKRTNSYPFFLAMHFRNLPSACTCSLSGHHDHTIQHSHCTMLLDEFCPLGT